jgi:glycosyltransferase involved in cell wall biosynthesis
MLETAGLSGGLWTALRTSELVRTQHAAFRALVDEVDGIVALKDWVRSLLLLNGVPDSKITLSSHGLSGTPHPREPLLVDVASMPFRVAFLGRADKVKGADTLIRAVRAAPDLGIELDLYGIAQGAADAKYWAGLTAMAAPDARISLLPPVSHDEVVGLLSTYHVLAVPSRWLETGPLVVLESFAAGTPVIGSNLGGIIDWVHHGVNGLLVDCKDVQGWTAALRACAENRSLLASLRGGVVMPRNMIDVAAEMAELYRKHHFSIQHLN